MDVSLARLTELLSAFPRQRIIVVGDLMLDQMIIGEARRISPEAPIPVVSFVTESFSPGGAANVARNVAALGATVDLFGVVGADADADRLRECLGRHRVGGTGLISEPARATTVKTRITAQHQQVVRLDRETTHPIRAETAQRLGRSVHEALPGAAALIIADYAKGVVEQPLLDEIVRAAHRCSVPVCVDPKPGHPLSFRGCALLTPNRRETFELAGARDPGPTANPLADPALLNAVAKVQQIHAPDTLLVTLSEAGVLLVDTTAAPRHFPTQTRQVFDVTGAGDTVMAAFVLARAAHATTAEAAVIANHCAGIVVGKTGTAAVTPDELQAWLARVSPPLI